MSEAWIVVIIGAFFMVLGVGAIIWGFNEERRYYDSLATRYDIREFIERLPRRPEPGSLKTGGVISLVIGAVMLIAGFILLY
jgi:uncharacterized membrane protein HdeD (DUF308 family)